MGQRLDGGGGKVWAPGGGKVGGGDKDMHDQ